MIHGHGGNINEISRLLNCKPPDRFIRISLKTPEDNHLLASRLIALCHDPEMEFGALRKPRVAR